MTKKNSDTGIDRVELWLFISMILVVAMIVLGGATRLTNSGLSITEWAPIKGMLPPLNNQAWISEFEKYKLIPEFLAEHSDMDLAAFKVIYFWEWSHRQLGRIIGLVYAIPLLYFIMSNKIKKGKLIKFLAILFLICTQGFIGWWMVSSGLINDRVDVSQYRLATHLGVAFIILACLFWLWKNQRESWPNNSGQTNLIWLTSTLSFLVYLQIILGAFVAGLKAGRTYNTWPLMDGDLIPKGYMSLNPYWRNIFENIAAVQFNHRTLAYIIILFTIWVFIAAKNNHRLKRALIGFKLLLVLQILLGIFVLLTGDALWLALTHQFSAIILWLSIVNVTRLARFS